MSQLEDLQEGIEALNTKLGEIADAQTDFAVDFKAAVDALKAQIAAGGVDLGPALASLSALLPKADAIASSIKSLDAEAEGISGVPTPTPPAP